MRVELERELIKKYLQLFQDINKPPTESLMCFGCECGDGWYNLLDETLDKISRVCSKEYRLVQVKEKYGSLRIYDISGNEAVWNITDEAEQRSVKICEVCGKPGKLYGKGWVVCRCKEHKNV